MKKIGLVTIGQSPRVDLTPEVKAILGNKVEIVEKGALDGLTLEQVKELYPQKDDEVLVSRMADGTEVKVSERVIFPKLVNQIKNLEAENIQVIFLACTGKFPDFESKSLVIRPQLVLLATVSAIGKNSKLGVIVPDEAQKKFALKRWGNVAKDVIVTSGSPYGGLTQVEDAAEKLSSADVDIVVMDCIGYTLEMKDRVWKMLKKPVILARSITTKVISELI